MFVGRTEVMRVLSFLTLALGLFLSGCATPIGVVRGTTQQTYYSLTANVLSAGEPSDWSAQALHRANLYERFNSDPEAALKEMRKAVDPRVAPEVLFALAELSFYHAEKSGKNDYYLASAVYAYAFLFPEDGTSPPDPIDPRRRLAADIYNLGLIGALHSPDRERVVLQDGKYELPFGEVELKLEASGFLWGGYRMTRFIPVGEFDIRGLRNRYRQAGIGAALAAEVEPLKTGANIVAVTRIAPRTKVPVTAFVRIEEPRRGVVSGKLRARLELYAADQASAVKIHGAEVPLELQPTAALAYQLEGAPVWDFELAGFRFADPQRILGDGLVMMHPYRPGRIPIVLVHGTASSPARWAEMYNELMHDPVVKGRFQFWLFQYNTGQPILYSASLMRQALRRVIQEIDPKGEDPALQRMIIIGHSQGGLLTRLMATRSGNRFWENVTDEPFEKVEMPSETRELFRPALFFEPVPTVKRVVFISTPHRGSYRATDFVVNILRRIMTLPGTLVSQFQHLLTQPVFAQLHLSGLPTSVENMSPGHPFLRALNDLPIDSGVPAHSIIAVLGDPPFIGKTDGVVAYESAHIDGVVSEKIVRSGHSTQGHPETIEEVRRILREHLGLQ
jgi:pimeloyl-ACP methyl ester carboxylesterase